MSDYCFSSNNTNNRDTKKNTSRQNNKTRTPSRVENIDHYHNQISQVNGQNITSVNKNEANQLESVIEPHMNKIANILVKLERKIDSIGLVDQNQNNLFNSNNSTFNKYISSQPQFNANNYGRNANQINANQNFQQRDQDSQLRSDISKMQNQTQTSIGDVVQGNKFHMVAYNILKNNTVQEIEGFNKNECWINDKGVVKISFTYQQQSYKLFGRIQAGDHYFFDILEKYQNKYLDNDSRTISSVKINSEVFEYLIIDTNNKKNQNIILCDSQKNQSSL